MARGKSTDEFSLASGNEAGNSNPESGNGNGDSSSNGVSATVDPAAARGTDSGEIVIPEEQTRTAAQPKAGTESRINRGQGKPRRRRYRRYSGNTVIISRIAGAKSAGNGNQ